MKVSAVYLYSFIISLALNATFLMMSASYFSGAEVQTIDNLKLTLIQEQPTPEVKPIIHEPWELIRPPEDAALRPLNRKPVKKLVKKPAKKKLKKIRKKIHKPKMQKTEFAATVTSATSTLASMELSPEETQEDTPYAWPVHAPVSNSLFQSSTVIKQQYSRAAYIAYIKGMIGKGKKLYPPAAKMMDMEGDVTVQFQVRPDGSIIGVGVLKSSGYDLLDEAAMNYVKQFKRFNKVPFPLDAPFPLKVTLEYRITG